MSSETVTRTYMDPQFAVFNLHINDAGRKADQVFINTFGPEKFDRIMKPIHEEGIMAIFRDGHESLHTGFWIGLVTAFVNEGRAPIPGYPEGE